MIFLSMDDNEIKRKIEKARKDIEKASENAMKKLKGGR